MANKLTLNVKNMKETYLNARMEMQEVWSSFYMLHCLGYITYQEWDRFFKDCHSWVYVSTENKVIDMNTDKVIKEF